MARVLTWNIMFLYFQISFSQVFQSSPHVDPKYSKLNLHFDHCKHPMVFSKVSLTCECPEPLRRIADTCICVGCIYLEIEEKYVTGASADVPQFIDEIIEEFDDETQGNSLDGQDNVDITPIASTPGAPRKKKHLNDIRHYEKNKTLHAFKILNLKRSNGKQKGVIPFLEKLHGFRRMFPESHSNGTNQKDKPVTGTSGMKLLKVKAQSLSVISSAAQGDTEAGMEKSTGSIESHGGTGSLALGSGDGSAASAAFVGPGKSNLSASSQGSFSKGVTMIGSGTANALSSNIVSAGSGINAAAANAIGQQGMASGAAVSTGQAASAATAATGNASSSAAAEDSPRQSKTGMLTLRNSDNKIHFASSSSAGSTSQNYDDLKNKEAKSVDTSSFNFKPKTFDFESVFNR